MLGEKHSEKNSFKVLTMLEWLTTGWWVSNICNIKGDSTNEYLKQLFAALLSPCILYTWYCRVRGPGPWSGQTQEIVKCDKIITVWAGVENECKNFIFSAKITPSHLPGDWRPLTRAVVSGRNLLELQTKVCEYFILGWDLATARYQPRPCGQQKGFTSTFFHKNIWQKYF